MVAVHRRGHRGAHGHALGGLRHRAEPDPSLTRLSGLPPGLNVIAARDGVEARALGLDGLLEQVARFELLVGRAEPVLGLGHLARLLVLALRRPYTRGDWG